MTIAPIKPGSTRCRVFCCPGTAIFRVRKYRQSLHAVQLKKRLIDF
jgi:hypothetical protein